LVAGLVLAQPQQGNRGQGPGGFGNRTPEEMRQMMEERMAERMKEQLELTDAEWTALKPFIQKVTDLSRQTGGGGMMGGRGGMMGGQAPEGEQSEVQKAMTALQETLDKEAPSATEIKAKLTALRGAREKARQDLVKAQESLKEVLSVKQEAQLVMNGTLE